MGRTKALNERHELIASIRSCGISYALVDHRPSVGRLDGEAILEVTACIDAISGSRSVPIGSLIKVSLCHAQSYFSDKREDEASLPMLAVNLRKGSCSALIYLPSDVFWGLRTTLYEGHLSQLTLSYGPVRYGSADLISFEFSADQHTSSFPGAL